MEVKKIKEEYDYKVTYHLPSLGDVETTIEVRALPMDVEAIALGSRLEQCVFGYGILTLEPLALKREKIHVRNIRKYRFDIYTVLYAGNLEFTDRQRPPTSRLAKKHQPALKKKLYQIIREVLKDCRI